MCYNWTTNNAKIENIDVRSGMKNDISRLIILTKYFHWKWAWTVQGIPTIWICFASKGVLQNGSVFWYPTHTSVHFYVGVAAPSPPPVPRVERDKDGLPAITGFSVFVFGHGSLGSKLHITCFILVYFVCACSITFLFILRSLHTKIKIYYSQGLSRLWHSAKKNLHTRNPTYFVKSP